MTPAGTTLGPLCCPDAEQFVRLVDGDLDGAAAEAIDRHVDGCGSCFELLAALAGDGGRGRPEGGDRLDATTPLRAGDRAGRHVITELVGRGGMGLVYAAYDPLLRRTVALKLVRPLDGGRSAEAQRAQLLREAQALARLSHPNVVPIHDVGMAGEHLWVVMELIHGLTLRAWAQANPQAGWRERLEIILVCGEALAAAHAAGVVHRDFKPDNVMLGDGSRAQGSTVAARVRVMDFGLAHVAVDHAGPGTESTRTATGGDSDPTRSTRGAIGTPAYMAPEQHLGLVVDAQADQFALAVTAFELLWGTRPFAGEDAEALVAAISAGRVREPPRGEVPRRLSRVLLRALSADPSARYPSMAALLAALRHDPRLARRGALVVGVLLLATVTSFGVRAVLEHRTAQRCRERAQQALIGNDDDPAGAVERALGVDAIASTVGDRLATWSAQWADADTASCVAAHDDEPRAGVGSPDHRACLREGAAAFRGAVAVLTEGDPRAGARALEIIEDLPGPASCDDRSRRPVAARDQATLVAVTELRERLARARVLQSAGRDRDALALADVVVVEARTLDDEAALAEALETAGGLRRRLGEFERAEQELAEAYWTAGRAGRDETAARAAAAIAHLIAAHLARPEDSRAWVRHAEMMLDRADQPQPREQLALLDARATVAWYRGDYAAALTEFGAAQELGEATAGPTAAVVGTAAANLGIVSYELGRYADALTHLDRAIAIHTAAWGPSHPDVARDRLLRANALLLGGRTREAEAEALAADAIAERAIGPDHPDRAAYYTGLGAIANTLGDTDAALRWHEAALALQLRTLGPDHPKAGIELNNIGSALDNAGRHDEAIVRFRESLATFRRAYGEDHDKVGAALHDLALAEHSAGRLADAVAHYREAFVIWERMLGGGHVMLGRGRMNLGNALLDAGDPDAAIEQFGAALVIMEAARGPDDPMTAVVLSNLGLTLQRHGQPAAAVAPLERALVLREGGADRERVAELRFGLAQALSASRGDRGRVRALASAAADEYRSLARTEQASEVVAFLESLD